MASLQDKYTHGKMSLPVSLQSQVTSRKHGSEHGYDERGERAQWDDPLDRGQVHLTPDLDQTRVVVQGVVRDWKKRKERDKLRWSPVQTPWHDFHS